jgi:hypothetical protein
MHGGLGFGTDCPIPPLDLILGWEGAPSRSSRLEAEARRQGAEEG